MKQIWESEYYIHNHVLNLLPFFVSKLTFKRAFQNLTLNWFYIAYKRSNIITLPTCMLKLLDNGQEVVCQKNKQEI